MRCFSIYVILIFSLLLPFAVGLSVFAETPEFDWELFLEDYKIHSIGIALDGDYIWCGADSAVIKFHKPSQTVDTVFTSFGSVTFKRPWVVAIDHEGILWVGGPDGGIAQYDGISWTHYTADDIGSMWDTFFINDIAVDDRNVKWFAAEHNFIYYDNETWYENQTLPTLLMWRIAIDQQNHKWSCGMGGGPIVEVDEINDIVTMLEPGMN